MNNYVLGLELLIIGMGTVFLSLYLLSVFLHFSGKLFGPENKARKTTKKHSVQKKEAEKAAVKGISPQKLAAVTAAIYESLSDQKKYRVISIQKSNRNWKR